jgi:hypothetical protein
MWLIMQAGTLATRSHLISAFRRAEKCEIRGFLGKLGKSGEKLKVFLTRNLKVRKKMDNFGKF